MGGWSELGGFSDKALGGCLVNLILLLGRLKLSLELLQRLFGQAECTAMLGALSSGC
jgi:hypothetical protein